MFKSLREMLASFLPEPFARLMSPILVLLFIVLGLVFLALGLRKARKIKPDTMAFYMFISPWILGFCIFTIYPLAYSIFISFQKWDMISPMEFIGWDNYMRAFSGKDRFFWQSIKVTLYYCALSVPLQLIVGFLIALLMNQKVHGMRFFRTIFYMPALVGGVAVSMLWACIFGYDYGLFNNILRSLSLPPQHWLSDGRLVIPSLVIMNLWSVGGGMVVYLAGLQDIPTYLYEAAEIDGASTFTQFKHITIPMMSPIIFFNLINGIIGSFQTFTQSFIMTNGGPNGASMFYVLNLYQQAFSRFRMGYASALAWILFIIILFFTVLIFKSSSLWVFYESEMKSKRVNAPRQVKGGLVR